MSAARSLVLVTVDCLRADHVGFLGYERPTTPFLDSLAKGSLVFRNAIAAGVPTYYSFPAIMASRYPLALGRDVIGLAPGEPTLATVLHEAGYATAAFIAGNPYLSRRFGYAAGFDVFEDFLHEASVASPPPQSGRLRTRLNSALARTCHKLGPLGRVYDEIYFRYCLRLAKQVPRTFDELRRYPSADVIVRHACSWVSALHGRPFFLWLHLMDPHAPYYPPADALALLGGPSMKSDHALKVNLYWNRDLGLKRLERYREEIIRLYDAGICWVDEQLRLLNVTLARLGLWEDCVFALTADHGEEFLDHGGRFHSPANVHDDLVRVPLLLRRGKQTQGREINSPFSLLELLPTLLEAAGVEVPDKLRRSEQTYSRRGDGSSGSCVVETVSSCTNALRPQERMGARKLAIRNDRYKLIFDFRSASSELFDLESDPREMQPLQGDHNTATQVRLLAVARQHLLESGRSRDLSLRVSARLRDMASASQTSSDQTYRT